MGRRIAVGGGVLLVVALVLVGGLWLVQRELV
jgi:hypothetical protein